MLRAIAARCTVTGPDQWLVDSQLRLVAVSAHEHPEKPPVHDDVAQWLYSTCYVAGSATSTKAGYMQHELQPADVLAELQRANPTRARWSSWVAEQVLPDGSVVARRRQLRRTHLAGTFISYDAPLGRVAVGSRIAVLSPRESNVIQAGYYHCISETPWGKSESARVARFYFHAHGETMAVLLSRVARLLNSFAIPFQAKCNILARVFPRADSVTIFTPWQRSEAFARILMAHPEAWSGLLGDATPLFALRLAPGVAFAEDPGTGDSFGMALCGLVADGLLDAWRQACLTVSDRAAAIGRRFVTSGIDLDHPYVRANSQWRPSFAEYSKVPSLRRNGNGKAIHSRDERRPRSGALVRAGTTIARRIAGQALWYQNRCNWIERHRQLENGDLLATTFTLGPDVYGGLSGVGLFLAEAWRWEQVPELRATARGALMQAVDSSLESNVDCSHGLYTGLPGVAYALIRAAARLEDADVEAAGVRVVEECSQLTTAIRDVTEFDLVRGLAGTIVAMCALPRRFRSTTIPISEACATQLLRLANRSGDRWSWSEPTGAGPGSEHDFTGLSHGTAGVALALMELYSLTHVEQYRHAAARAVEYEIATYAHSERNWPDHGPCKQVTCAPRFLMAWCHGAPGILLARRRCRQLGLDDNVADNACVEQALAQVREEIVRFQSSEVADWSLCHGFMGICEVALAYRAKDGGAMLRACTGIIRAGARVRDMPEESWECGSEGGVEFPSLMAGLSGIGLQLLRIGTRARVRSVLIASE